MSVTSLEDLTGRYGVTIGQSLMNAWNERNGKTTKRAKEYPNPEFYSLRYSFKPESIDNEGLGSLRPKAADGHIYELERPGTKGGMHRFNAVEQRSKDWECILLWDPETRTLKLERLESTLNLTFEGQSSAPASATNRKGKALAPEKQQQQEDDLDDITKALMDELDAEGEKDDGDIDIEELLDDTPKRREEAESEIEAIEVEQQLPPPQPVVERQPKGKATAKASPKTQKAQKAQKAPKAPKAPSKPKATAKAKAAPAVSKKGKEKGKEKEKEKYELAVENPEEEELSFGQRSRPVEPSYQNDPATNSGWAFPSLPSSQTPSVPVRHAQPTPSDLLQPPSSSANNTIQYESDSDPEVMQSGGAGGGNGNGGGDDGDAFDAVDEDMLAHEMELLLGEDNNEDEEDDLELVPLVPIEAEPAANGRPYTLNELVGHNGNTDNSDDDDDDDDDDTSSDDTDDD